MLLDDFRAKARWLYEKDGLSQVCRAMVSDGSLAMALYRNMSFCNRIFPLKPLAFFFCKLNGLCAGTVIGLGARFGSGFVILHGSGVVINGKVRGGERIYVESGVVIGESKRGCPVLGSDIFLGSGAKVFGAITIGNNVTIGANAVVNGDVPDNVVVAGIPAKIVRTKGAGEFSPVP